MTSPVSKDTNWRVPYKDWTAIDLVLANFLRPTPLPLRDLVLYAAHRLKSLQNAKETLRADGRLLPDNTPNLDHPKLQALKGTPKLLPLPDPGARPLPRNQATARASARTHMEAALSDAATGEELTRKSAALALARWITSGEAGKDTPRFIDSWAELVGTAAGSGPPAPTTPSDTRARLLRLLLACPEPDVRATITSWEAHLADPLLSRKADALPPGDSPSSLAQTD